MDRETEPIPPSRPIPKEKQPMSYVSETDDYDDVVSDSGTFNIHDFHFKNVQICQSYPSVASSDEAAYDSFILFFLIYTECSCLSWFLCFLCFPCTVQIASCSVNSYQRIHPYSFAPAIQLMKRKRPLFSVGASSTNWSLSQALHHLLLSWRLPAGNRHTYNYYIV